jgi:hypothetical protein
MHNIRFSCRSHISAKGGTIMVVSLDWCEPLFRNTLECYSFISKAMYFSHTCDVNIIWRVLWPLMFLLIFLTVNIVEFLAVTYPRIKVNITENLQLVCALRFRIWQFFAVEIVLISFKIFICQLIDCLFLFLIWTHRWDCCMFINV